MSDKSTKFDGTIVTADGVTSDEPVSCQFNTENRTEIDMDTAATTFVTTEPGLLDNGSVQMRFIFDPNSAFQVKMESLARSGLEVNFSVQFPEGVINTRSFTGYIENDPFSAPLNSRMEITYNIVVTSEFADLP